MNRNFYMINKVIWLYDELISSIILINIEKTVIKSIAMGNFLRIARQVKK